MHLTVLLMSYFPRKKNSNGNSDWPVHWLVIKKGNLKPCLYLHTR